jgi:hypothetical protein
MPIQRTIYLDDDLFLHIMRRSRATRRSFSKEINVMLETLLDREASEREQAHSSSRAA